MLDVVRRDAFVLTCLLTHLPTHLPTYLPTHLPNYLPTNPPTRLPTYLLTDSNSDSSASSVKQRQRKPAKSGVGTPDFLAPEILRRETCNEMVDYWALGVVLYQFLVGETPFNAERVQMVYAKILAGESAAF